MYITLFRFESELLSLLYEKERQELFVLVALLIGVKRVIRSSKKNERAIRFLSKNDRFARKTKEQIPKPAGMFVKKSLGSNKKTVVHIHYTI